MRGHSSNFLLLAVGYVLPLLCPGQSPVDQQVGPLDEKRYLTATNQVLDPAGIRLEITGQRVTDVAVARKGDLVAAVSQNVVAFFRPNGTPVSRVNLSSTASLKGSAFSPDGKTLAVSVVASCGVVLIDVASHSQKSCVIVGEGSVPAGLVFDASGTVLYALLNRSNLVAKIDVASGTVAARIPVGVAPLGVALTPDGKRLFVTNMGGSLPKGGVTADSSQTPVSINDEGIASSGSVSVIDTSTFKVFAELPVELHPSGISASADGRCVAVANANSDTISLIDTAQLSVAPIAVPGIPVGTAGAAPSDLTFSKDGRRLYVTLGGANAVAEFDIDKGTYVARGFAPTDWYPAAIAVAQNASGDDILFVANSKGVGAGNQNGPNNVRYFVGTVNAIPATDIGALSSAATENANNPFAGIGPHKDAPNDLHSLGIQHVFLIVKENRTYDQVLGDIPAGNGDPNLAIYGQRITPNLHNMANGFVLLDNYYASGTVSADGHQWITQATATGYAERQAAAGWPRSYPYSGEDPLIFASTGFIWGNAMRHGLTARVFGEFALQSAPYPGTWVDYVRGSVGEVPRVATPSVSSVAPMSSIQDHSYPAFNLTVSDTYRARIVIDEIGNWEAAGSAPNLVIIQLPADHTVGITPGEPTPQVMVADNDLAAGRILEGISHSSFWSNSAVFITEDDSQDGVDHVDGHRTTCYLASPFARRGQVDSTQYNHTSVIRTIEDLLGLPAMNRFDATAVPMRNSFTATADYKPFDAVMTNIPLDQLNPPLAQLRGAAKKAARESLAMNFTVPDAAPEKKLNRILWQQAKGWKARYPKPPHKKNCPKDADD